MNILYARSHLTRKPAFRILTRFVQSGQCITVVKSPICTEATTHIKQTLANETLLEDELSGIVTVLRGEQKKDALQYSYLPESTLELKMEEALIAKDFAKLHHLFQQGLYLIGKLPIKQLVDHPNPQGYGEWFGQLPPTDNTYVTHGVIDFTPGNIVMTQPQPTLLDCEWVAPFPVERELIQFRYLWNLITKFSSLFKVYASHFDLLVIGNPDFVVPHSWLTAVLGKADTHRLNHFLQKEASFQTYVLNFQKDVVPKNITLLPYNPSTEQTALPAHSQDFINPRIQKVREELVKQQVEITSTRVEKLREEVSKKDTQIVDLQHQLYVIHHSRWWRLLYIIKHPQEVTQKIAHRTKMLAIRLKSNLRRLRHGEGTSERNWARTDLSTLKLSSAPETTFVKPQPIDVIVPVHNAGAEVRRCIESVLRFSPKNVHVYLIDDISTDPELKQLYSEIKDHPQVTIHYNKTRQGFVKNINTGFALSKHDAIILNTDTEVTENWVSKLHSIAYAKANVGTVTPMTNNGEILSLPNFIQPNLLSEKYTLAEHNQLAERFSAHQRIEVPTGIGFCMYIKREVIDVVGNFDAETYGMGYGEENDFCQRAIQAGYINVIDDSTFIYHRGTMSFTSEEKQAYVQNNLRILFGKFPNYERDVHTFIAQNPLKYLQELIKLAIDKPDLFSEPAVLFVVHKDPYRVVGGVEVDVKRMLSQIGPVPLFFVMHRDDNLIENKLYIKAIKGGKILHEFVYQFERPFMFLDLEHEEVTWFWQWVMKAFPNIHTVHLEHTYGMPLAGLRAFGGSHRKVIVNFHDFYYVCPYEKLVNTAVPEYIELEQNINACYKSLAKELGSLEAANNYRQQRMEIVTEFFTQHVDTFVFNSEYTLEEHRKVWPKVFTKKNSTIIDPYA